MKFYIPLILSLTDAFCSPLEATALEKLENLKSELTFSIREIECMAEVDSQESSAESNHDVDEGV